MIPRPRVGGDEQENWAMGLLKAMAKTTDKDEDMNVVGGLSLVDAIAEAWSRTAAKLLIIRTSRSSEFCDKTCFTL